MKKSFVLPLLLFLSAAASAQTAPSPKLVNVPLRTAYVPGGFDSNDVVQFVVEGYFPNSCYRPGVASARVNRPARMIEVSQTAFQYSGLCLEAIIPFDQVINVGVLEAGRYDIVQPGVRGRLETLNVRATVATEPDEYLYAPVSQALFQSRGGGAGDVIVTGEFTLSCMSLDTLRVSVEPRAIVVQPIAKVEPGQPCSNGVFPFQRSVSLRGAPGRYVLHVRSMNGKAINSLVDIR